jgi:hypothetical protein
MSAPSTTTSPSSAFVILTFVAAIAIGVLIAYLGITGRIGAGVP